MHLMDKLGQSIVHINRLYEQWAKQQGIATAICCGFITA